MTRLWLLRLAPLILAALQLGTPRVVSAAEIRTAAQPTGVAPAIELCGKAVLAGAASREQVRFETTPFAPAVPVRLALHRVLVARATPALRKCPAGSARLRHPPARAPPAPF